MALVAAVEQVQSLARELVHAVSEQKKNIYIYIANERHRKISPGMMLFP